MALEEQTATGETHKRSVQSADAIATFEVGRQNRLFQGTLHFHTEEERERTREREGERDR